MPSTVNRCFFTPFLLVVALFLGSSAVSLAAIPEPKSGGKFAASKGTKADEDYAKEGRAGAEGYVPGRGIEFWDVLVKPFAQYIGQYESNIFYNPEDPSHDYIHRLNAGLTGELPLNGGQHLLSGGFTEQLEWFDRFSTEDHNDYSVNGQLDLNFVPFSLNVEDTHKRTVDRADTEFTNRITRQENVASGLLEVPFAAFFLETEALNMNTQYTDPLNEVFNHNDFTVFQRVGVDTAPSTQILAEYGYENIDYPEAENRNGDANQVMLGVRGNLTERITYQAWGGTQWRIYDENNRPDFHGFITRAAAQYDISEGSSIILKLNRDPQESTFDGQSFYMRNKGSVGWKQQVADRVTLTTDGAVSFNEYSRISLIAGQQETRRDTVWESGAVLDYLMPNDIISFFLGYRFRGRRSNIDNFEYADNILNFGAKAAF